MLQKSEILNIAVIGVAKQLGRPKTSLIKIKEKFLAEKATMHDRLNECLRNIQYLKREKKALKETIKDMKIKQKDKEKAQQKLKSRRRRKRSSLSFRSGIFGKRA